jgi:hypothetical protein
MVNVTSGGRIDLGGSMPSMPNFRLAGSRILRLAAVVLVIVILLWSTTSIPTGNVGVLTLLGRVTAIAEGKRERAVERRVDPGLGHFFAVPLG